MLKKIIRFVNDEEAVTLAEYCVLLGLITVVLSIVISFFGCQLRRQFIRAGDVLTPR